MRKFSFNLERLLKIREHEEQESEIILGKAVTECVRIEREMQHRTNEIDRILKKRGNLDSCEDLLFSMEMYKRRMNKDLKQFGKELEKAEAERDKVRENYLEVSKRRKVLSKLKEKREAEYYKQQIKIEHDLLDEMNNGRAANRTLF